MTMGFFDLTSLLLMLVVAGVQSADRDLGEPCTSADSCVHPQILLACDTVTGTCAVQHGAICDEPGYDHRCVAGAECSSVTRVCVCKSSLYTATSDGKCDATAGKWGAACSSNSCGNGMFCSQVYGVCKCSTGQVVDLSTGECSDIPAQRVGYLCNAGSATTACGTTGNLQCPSGGGTCQCAAGYLGPKGGTCVAVASGQVGLACTTNATCGATMFCDSGRCMCKDGSHGVIGNDCYPKARTLGGGCTRCSATTNVCTGTTDVKTCECQVGLDDSNGECTAADGKVGGACIEDSDCEDANASCSFLTSTCTCNLLGGFTGVDGGGCTDLFGGASTLAVPVTSLVVAAAFSLFATV
ncbi:cell death abnormality protein 1-like [Littorina saxatilis]|uniref:Uncharacterized protein n=1 Tax=Littorina saxatilis TaxID=31220 RepID=A0AAN9BB27_9CAEN